MVAYGSANVAQEAGGWPMGVPNVAQEAGGWPMGVPNVAQEACLLGDERALVGQEVAGADRGPRLGE